MKGGKITIKDVAEYAGVSPATVSRVLNDYKWVNPEVKVRVQKAIEELNYVPDFTAKMMVKGKSQMAIVIVPVIDNHFFTQLINTIILELKKYGYYVMVYTTESEDEEISFLNSSICQMADGILNATSLKDLTPMYSIRNPMVLMDRHFQENTRIDCVMNQNYEAMYQGTQYLIEKGHRRIALIIGGKGYGIAEERIRGYGDCMKAHGLPLRKEYLIQDSWKRETGTAYTRQLLESEEPPTAILAGNNTLTAGVLEELSARRLVPGKDISLIGFEECDEDSQTFGYYGISCFRLNTSSIAAKAVELLLNRIRAKGELKTQIQSLKVDFIQRESVADISHAQN